VHFSMSTADIAGLHRQPKKVGLDGRSFAHSLADPEDKAPP
jgi:hypothetical protein